MLRRLFSKRVAEIKEKYSGREILAEADANFFGLESRGMLQIRGNGLLLLTRNELIFGMFKPATDIIIPLSKVTAIDITKWHLNKSVSKPLLKIFFTNQDNVQDSSAWWVYNLREWKMLIEKLVKEDAR